MNTALKYVGLRTNATAADQAIYWLMYAALLLGGCAGAMTAGSSTQSFAFNFLNGCVDPRADASQLGEQPYRPSQAHLDCIEGPHRTAFLLGAVAVVAVLLVATALLTLATQHLVFADFVRLDNKPASAKKVFSRIYRGHGVAALVLVMITLILVGPRS